MLKQTKDRFGKTIKEIENLEFSEKLYKFPDDKLRPTETPLIGRANDDLRLSYVRLRKSPHGK